MLVLNLDPVIEQRVTACARDRGLSTDDLLRALIQSGLDDLDDARLAEERLANPQPPVTTEQARRALGLDD